MKRLIQKSLFAILVLVLGVSIFLSSAASAAGTATISLSPSSGTYTVGSTIAIAIYEDSGTADCSPTPASAKPSECVNAVQANLSYNPSLLTFTSIASSSAFNIDAQSTGGGGTVQIGRGVSNQDKSVSGSQIVATVRFTASAAGSATVSFTGGTAVVRANDNGSETLTTTGATYTISAPVTPPTPPPAPTPAPSPSPTPPPTPPPSTPGKTTPPPATPGTPPASPSTPPSSPTANPAPPPSFSSASPTPSDISVSNLTDKTATITWTTAVPTTTELDYGLNAQYGISVVDPKLTTDHTVVLSSKILIPGSTFHYMVKGVDASGNLIASGDKTFATAKAGSAKKSGSSGTIIAAVVVLGLLAAGGGSFFWIKNGGSKPQWSGFEPAVQPEPTTTTGAPAGQVVKPAGSGEIKPGENIVKPGPGPQPPA